MNSWMFPAIISLTMFGLWGLFTKLTVNFIDAKSAFVYQTIGVMIAGVFILYLANFKLEVSTKGITYGILTGLAYGVGCLFYFVAANRGEIINVVTLTALYPLVTIALSFIFLRESIDLRQGIGIVFALIAMVLFTG